ncbi:2-amino-4-hydroxy-6-hydroxymethyldihydropteridine diphosphokinase [Atopomonas sediminilitoris]|uniref:2-amino-4-hydroxy-6- hydroxymethyldihydropteridine diphosphokinase n=1 Tax=Atopomonas sediminilitoris TaxID=2919919 RepID=UPI001F4D7257|nr:2-amino-4-hydroxy-6-hydroxymethyldihydropteridine diphosphokinase [Atopomonas sediminilitoris]MCJ8168840.1 2-amino-4-hydroxy-6-hydroxymethyldihydropteridine diphosphokinase [Atopomonas sediminilitoris]
MARVFIGLGSNLAEPRQQLHNALSALTATDGISQVRCSPLYASDPLGPADQPRYLNAVAELATTLAPLELLDVLQRIELEQGRERKDQRWGPRTLDLDILLYDQQQIDHPRLQVPHYHMHARAFVLYPLADLAPELILPNQTRLQTLLAACPFAGLERLD